jgi:hypothetical protein
MEPQRKGDLTEAVVLAELKRRNVPVSVPFGDNERYDLVAESDGRLWRLQVKTGRLRDGKVVFETESMHTNSQGNVYERYDGDVDYFTVYCHEIEELYLVREDEVETGMSLRIDQPERADDTINWAEDYEFDERWPPSPDDRLSGSRALDRALSILDDTETTVAEPRGDQPYDLLLADADDEFHPVAVRAGHRDSGTVRFAPLDRSDTPGVAFHLIVHPEEETLYCLRDTEFGRQCRLRVDEPAFETSQINWAEEYEFTERWPPARCSEHRPPQ